MARSDTGAEIDDEPRDAELDRVLRESPDDDNALLVYADMLHRAGHPRGELISLGVSLRNAQNTVLRAYYEAEAERRMREAKPRLLGTLANRYWFVFDWKAGFIQGARFVGSPGDPEQELAELLAHPSARLLRDLSITLENLDDYAPLVARLCAASPPLRRLELHRGASFVTVGSLDALAAISRLEVLEVQYGTHLDLSSVALPHLRHLALRARSLRPSTLAALAAEEHWPVLEELELWFENGSCRAQDVASLFGVLASRPFRVLRTRGVRFADDLAAVFVASPLAGRLEELDLRDSNFGPAGGEILLAARERLGKLRVRCNTGNLGEAVWLRLRESTLLARESYWYGDDS